MKKRRASGAETFTIVFIVLGLGGGLVYLFNSGNKSRMTEKDPARSPAVKVKEEQPPEVAAPKDEGDGLLAAALEQFTAGKTEKELEKIREDRLIELAGSKIPLNERRGINQAIEAMYERAYKRLGIPPGVAVRESVLAEGVYRRTGIPYQEVRLVLENTGKLPVSEVWGTVSALGGDGKLMTRREMVCLYVEEAGKPVFGPGVIVSDEAESGEAVAFRDEPRAAEVHVEITKVVH